MKKVKTGIGSAEKIIGIMGGMGPSATVDLFSKIIQYTPASKDQDHIRVIIDSNPKIPDRTAAILGDGMSPLPLMRETALNLARAGVDLILCPCNTAHHWYEDLQRSVDVPIMHMMKEVASYIDRLAIKRVGLLATTGTLKAQVYHNVLDEARIDAIVPSDRAQAELVMGSIYEIKAGRTSEAKRSLIAAAEVLISEGAEGIIAGCTEIPLVLNQNDIPILLIDPTSVLAEAAVRKARGLGSQTEIVRLPVGYGI